MRLTTKQALLVEYLLVVAIVVPIVLMCCALAITFDLHVARVEFASANADWRRESLRRVDQLLWKADTALELGGAMRFDLGIMLTKLRVQVKQSSDESTKSAQKQTQVATAAVTQAIDTTRQAIEAVAGDAPAQPTSPDPQKQITVNVPAPVVVSPAKPTELPKVEVTVAKKKTRRRWFTYIWRWW
jgi:hypothetical protein